MRNVACLLIGVVAACTGGGGGTSSLVRIDPEAPGANCEHGGVAISTGLDEDDDGILEDDEVQSISYVCDGGDGEGGVSTLVETSTEPAGANCATGGTAISIGADTDGDGALDAGEVTQVLYVCNGTDGPHVLVGTATEPTGANCALGGIAIQTGIDDDLDGTLDAAEVDATSYVCNGPDGTVIGPVLEGSYLVRNSFDLAVISGVERITGDLTFDAPGLTAASLPNLQRVDGFLTTSSGNDELATLSLPALTEAGFVGVDLPALTSLDLSALTTTPHLDLYTPALADAELPALTSAGVVHLVGSFSSVDLGALDTVTTLQIQQGVAPLDLSLPSLTTAWNLIQLIGPGFRLVSMPALETASDLYLSATDAPASDPLRFDLPASAILGELSLNANPGAIDVSSLTVTTITGELAFYGNAGLTEIAGWDLISVGGELLIQNNASLEVIDFPALQSIGIAQLGPNAGWRSLTMPALIAAGATFAIDSTVVPRCHATDIQARLVAHGWTGTMTGLAAMPPCVAVDWCRLQFPVDAATTVGAPLTYYGRYYGAGFTTQTTGNQASAMVAAAIGVGPDGTDPATSTAWTWTPATANPGWDGAVAGEPNNDEWQATVSAPAAGTYDTAFRFSGDAGRTWRTCDRNACAGADGSEDGYQLANAGSLVTN